MLCRQSTRLKRAPRLQYDWVMNPRLIIAALTAILLAGCGDRLWRDDYMGKAFFQPDRVPHFVEYDGFGYAITDVMEIPPAPNRADQSG